MKMMIDDGFASYSSCDGWCDVVVVLTLRESRCEETVAASWYVRNNNKSGKSVCARTRVCIYW